MAGASSWYAMLAVAGYLSAVWLAGRISRVIGMSSIVLEVGTGLVLGPTVGGLIPGELSECWDNRYVVCEEEKFQMKIAKEGYKYCDLAAYIKEDMYTAANQPWHNGFFGARDSVTLDGDLYCLNPYDKSCKGRSLSAAEGDDPSRRLAGSKEGKTDHADYGTCLKESCKLKRSLDCATTPDIFTLIGHVGVGMMIFESGMHFDFSQVKTVGPWACLIAILGTFLPIGSGLGLAIGFGFEFEASLFAGVALAPTSVGIALKLLHEAKALDMYFGQAVMTAAFVDDVLSLILFSVIFSAGDGISAESMIRLGSGILFMAITIPVAAVVFPKFMAWLFEKIPEDKPDAKVNRHDEVMWLVMLICLLAYGAITHECGTHLWGCFIAGMNFSYSHHAHHVWVRQVKRMTPWFLRVFFSCTLAWSIPVNDLFSPEAFWKGTLMGIGPCILSKVLCAPFMGQARWAIGWAMVGRAEFAYFIAIMAKALQKMPDKLFAILLWALIYATIFAPLIFRKVLKRFMASQGIEMPQPEEAPEDGEQPKSKRASLVAALVGVGGHVDMAGSLPDKEAATIRASQMDDAMQLKGLKNCKLDYEQRIADYEAKIAEANGKLDEARKTLKEQAAQLGTSVKEI